MLLSLGLFMAHTAFAAISPATTLFTLPTNPSWLENLAYRPSTNTILATRLDVAQLWSISASTGAGTVLANVTDTTALVGITQTHSSPDEFYVAGLNFTTTSVQPNSSALWKLAFAEDDSSYTFEAAIRVPGMTLINGVTTWDETSILATDSYQGNIWKIDLRTGDATVVLQDAATMAFIDDHGVNGVKVLRSTCGGRAYVYYTATDTAVLARIPVDPVTALAVGAMEVIARDLGAVDDFALRPDGSAVIATGVNNVVVHVALNGTVRTVAEVASSTSCQFGLAGELYVTTGGIAVAGSVVAVDLE